MQRESINPVTWSRGLGFDQGVLVAGASRTLWISGQTAMDDAGTPQHEGDLAAQLTLALDNLEAVLRGADMALGHLVRLDVHATDVDRLMEQYGVLAGRLGAAGASPATTVVGVTRLVVPGQLVEIGGVAVS